MLSCLLQELYKQVAWPLFKLYGHAFEAFKQMVQDDGSAIIKRLEEDRGPLTVLTPAVSGMEERLARTAARLGNWWLYGLCESAFAPVICFVPTGKPAWWKAVLSVDGSICNWQLLLVGSAGRQWGKDTEFLAASTPVGLGMRVVHHLHPSPAQ